MGNRQIKNEKSKQRYYSLKEKGICTRCGKNKTNGQIRCDLCIKLKNENKSKKKINVRRLPRLCGNCGLRFQPTGKYQNKCDDCIIKCLKNNKLK